MLLLNSKTRISEVESLYLILFSHSIIFKSFTFIRRLLSHLKVSPVKVFLHSINGVLFDENSMTHFESSMRNAINNFSYCPHDASVFSHLPLDGINWFGNTSRHYMVYTCCLNWVQLQ